MKHSILWVVAFSAIAATAQAEDLCRVNPFTKSEAEAGRTAFNSSCALCHQYDMTGRIPGGKSGIPDINSLSEANLQFIDGAGGKVPPLIGASFFDKFRRTKSLTEFSSFVSSAANTFPPAGKVEMPKSYLEIAAYVLYRNCGRI